MEIGWRFAATNPSMLEIAACQHGDCSDEAEHRALSTEHRASSNAAWLAAPVPISRTKKAANVKDNAAPVGVHR